MAPSVSRLAPVTPCSSEIEKSRFQNIDRRVEVCHLRPRKVGVVLNEKWARNLMMRHFATGGWNESFWDTEICHFCKWPNCAKFNFYIPGLKKLWMVKIVNNRSWLQSICCVWIIKQFSFISDDLMVRPSGDNDLCQMFFLTLHPSV